jgi:hypothetical protein
MPRNKIYDTCELPRGVAQIAKAICADYDRRARALRAGIVDEKVRTTYTRLNAAVDAALSEIEEPFIRDELLRDMVARRGYDRSRARVCICERSYYARKRKVMYLVSKSLLLYA